MSTNLPTHHVALFEASQLDIAPIGPVVTLRQMTIDRVGMPAYLRMYRQVERTVSRPFLALPDDTRSLDHFIARANGYRPQPRDGRGRLLSKRWLAEAELYLPADRAWFAHPITEEK